MLGLPMIKALESAQGTSFKSLIQRISYYGGRRVEDFDKYEALRYAEELASVAKSSSDPKAATYDIIASTWREKLHVPAEQFKAYFLALLADKDFSRVIETVSKVDKSFRRSMPYRTQTRRGRLPYQQPYFQPHQRPPPRVICYRCGEPGHKSAQCWKRAPSRQPSSSAPSQPRPPRPLQ